MQQHEQKHLFLRNSMGKVFFAQAENESVVFVFVFVFKQLGLRNPDVQSANVAEPRRKTTQQITHVEKS